MIFPSSIIAIFLHNCSASSKYIFFYLNLNIHLLLFYQLFVLNLKDIKKNHSIISLNHQYHFQDLETIYEKHEKKPIAKKSTGFEMQAPTLIFELISFKNSHMERRNSISTPAVGSSRINNLGS